MTVFATPAQWILGMVLIASSLGVILVPKPVYASLSFLVSLLALACLYLQLSAEFIAVMQILVYAGSILVIFMLVIVLFQDAHLQIEQKKARSVKGLLIGAGSAFVLTFLFFGQHLLGLSTVKEASAKQILAESFGSVEALGQTLYVDFFFPFEAVVLLFLVSIIGALYIARKGD